MERSDVIRVKGIADQAELIAVLTLVAGEAILPPDSRNQLTSSLNLPTASIPGEGFHGFRYGP